MQVSKITCGWGGGGGGGDEIEGGVLIDQACFIQGDGFQLVAPRHPSSPAHSSAGSLPHLSPSLSTRWDYTPSPQEMDVDISSFHSTDCSARFSLTVGKGWGGMGCLHHLMFQVM